MNFFGHASVASWYEKTPSFVLGAMLPDFFSMLRMKPASALDPNLVRGIALHHLTDAAFHGAERFLTLTQTARVALSEAGLARGPARAVAHIGVELLLDEVLATEETARAAYLDALAHGQSHPQALVFLAEDDAPRLQNLLALLASRGAPESSAAPSQVAERIERALKGRPRLSLDEPARALVGNWVVRTRPDVVECAAALLSEVRARLSSAH